MRPSFFTFLSRGRRACVLAALSASLLASTPTAHADGDDAPLAAAPDYSRAEVDYLVRTEHVAHLSDVFLRRTSLAFTGAVSGPLVHEIGEITANALGWSPNRRSEEEDAFIAELAAAHRVHLVSGDGSEAAALR